MKLRLRKKKRLKVLSFNLSPGLTNPKAHLLSCISWCPIVKTSSVSSWFINCNI